MAEQLSLQTLYKKTSTGADQFWTIRTEGNTIVTRWGQVGGKEQETRDEVRQGKNQGKKNETSPVQQAQAEAQSQWEKKLKKGYVKDIESARAGEVDAIIEGGVSPMLAHRFDEQGHKIQYPAFAQPKFDGHRCIAVVKDGKATLWSRTRKPITGVPHIVADIEALVAKSPGTFMEDVVLDGELYNHDYKDRFEELTSFIRQVDPKPGHGVVQYHVYDIADLTQSQAARISHLEDVFGGDGGKKFGALRRVQTELVTNEDDLMAAFEGFLAQGYEGLMVRNAQAKYVNKRSYDLQKVKEFQDAEFPIVGVEEGRGKLAGHAIFVCQADDKDREDPTLFRVKLKGETSKLKEYFDNPGLVKGKLLTVKFQGYTNRSSVPRFPVGVRIREDV